MKLGDTRQKNSESRCAKNARKLNLTVKFNGTLEGNQLLQVALSLSISVFFKGNIQVGDISLVVLLVMNLHNFTANKRLKSAIIIRHIREGESLFIIIK
jgi:hypothetical protein